MNIRHTHRWIVWLLPLFALRAFIPVGFMLTLSDGGLQLVICSGSGPMGMSAGARGVDGQHHFDPHAANGQHEHSLADNATMCPFAVAGLSGALPSLDPVVVFIATVFDQVRPHSSPDLPASLVLIDRIRGPPFA